MKPKPLRELWKEANDLAAQAYTLMQRITELSIEIHRNDLARVVSVEQQQIEAQNMLDKLPRANDMDEIEPERETEND